MFVKYILLADKSYIPPCVGHVNIYASVDQFTDWLLVPLGDVNALDRYLDNFNISSLMFM